MTAPDVFDAIVVGGGPAGATAATDLARLGHKVLLLDRAGRIKPCGGAIPPRLIRDFAIPSSQIVARARSASIVGPSGRRVPMPIENGFVGMVDREAFDEWLRRRAEEHGALRRTGTFTRLLQEGDGTATVEYTEVGEAGRRSVRQARASFVVGADGANSAVARGAFTREDAVPYVFAYHEIVRTPQGTTFDGERCDVVYQGELSPDFYSWIFPHGDTISVGTGSARKGLSLRGSVARLRASAGLESAPTIRCEGAPLPLYPKRRWDNGRNVILAGDAAGVVAPASGEGIYYAMLGGRLAAEAISEAVRTRSAKPLVQARKRFMKAHGRVFWVLGMMQRFWYSSDARRERFVSICADPDVQMLTWEAYMNKRLVRARPAAHARIFFKDLAHLCGLVTP